MSGHSKWKQIKHKKGAADVKRGKLFSQLTKGITLAARTGLNLDMAIERAKAANMPAENIDRAIKKGTGELADGALIESLVYEAYGPGGSALIISVLTDNKNRTIGNIKTILKKADSILANSGSVQYLFDRSGLIDVALDPTRTQAECELSLIDVGAQEIQPADDHLVVVVNPTKLITTKAAIEAIGLQVLDARLGNVPKQGIKLKADDEEKLVKLMASLDDLDDVASIETNAELSE